MNDWITIATFTYPHQAAILKGRLEEEGILCFLKDENTIAANPFYSNAVGGVKIQVREDDGVKAGEIVKDYFSLLNNGEGNTLDVHEVYKTEESVESDNANVICPFCGSADVNRDKSSSYAMALIGMILGFLLFVPLIFTGGKKHHCFNCGRDFKSSKKRSRFSR